MIALLVVLLVAVLGFIGYLMATSKSRTAGPSTTSQAKPKQAAGSQAVAQDDDEDEATRVRVAGPRLVRTMGGLKIGDEIPIAGVLTIGRGQASTVRLHDAELSSVHAEFHIEKGQAVVVDQGSTNGTYVNGDRVDPHVAVRLKDGDTVKIGATNLVFKDPK